MLYFFLEKENMLNQKIDNRYRLGEVEAKALYQSIVGFRTSPFSFLTPIKKRKFLKVVKQHLDTFWAKFNGKTFKLENSLYWDSNPLIFQNP